jgi:hypothetical protein
VYDDYTFIYDIIRGEGYVQLNPEMSTETITAEFDELIASSPDTEEIWTVSTMLDSVYDYAESIIDILDKISTTDEQDPTQ